MTDRPAPHSVRRRWAMQMQQPLPASTLFDRVAFLVATASAVWLTVIIGLQGFRYPWSVLLFIPVWGITAYLVLPRLHRMLSDLYVPDYFFGRTRTAEGLLGDPVNLAVDGSAVQLDAVMAKAGWHRADEITAASTWGIIVSTLTRRSYPTAPVSPLMLFGRRHDVAYQQEVAGNPKQRHHVRFWHCPPGWLLPGGAKVGWLGAGTYDTDVGLSLFTLQLTHRIDENTDIERDYVVTSAQEADPAVEVRVLRDFTTGYHSRNGGGDRFITDGDLPILDVSAVSVDEHDVEEAAAPVGASAEADDAVHRAPLTVIGAAVIVIVGGLIDLLALFLDPEIWAGLAGRDVEIRVVLAVIVGGAALLTVGQIVMGWFVLRRGRRSRATLMILLTLAIIGTALSYLSGEQALRFNGTLLTASLECLALLALSSDAAGAWSRRRSREREEAAAA
ncbi:hypothetical protein J2Y69_003629 [Microbacterium resistens]|uniref:LssY-like C-terminal domain-containing protein n=1 Tax=Microbacterium resistens TaxID=156977 RepID=A0ABU1SHB3_9MICO|nr:LssY C-terminal domain-containing protein [Microbacterium resistens]MDR6869001.1 hypothetical protein [Microbacterium resistens]